MTKTPKELAEEKDHAWDRMCNIKRRGLLPELRNPDKFFFERGYNAGYEAGSAKWVSVEDRLPEVGKPVVGYRRIMGTMSIVFWSSAGKWMFAYDADYASDITHWLDNVPELPEVKQK